MFSALYIYGIVISAAWLIYKLLITPAYLSPLSSLPAPHWLCHLSARLFDRQCATVGELKSLYAAHQRLGPIVRLGPNEVSVVSEEGLKKIYASGLDKSDWYGPTFRVYGVQNLVCTLDHRTHSAMRKTIAGMYAKSHLQHSSDLEELSKRIVIDGLLPSMSRDGCGIRGMDVMKLFECVGVDFVTGYVFGATVGTDFLRDHLSRDRYFGEWSRLRDTPGLTEKPVTENLYLDMCKLAVTTRKDRGVDQERHSSVAAKMYEGLSSKALQFGFSEDGILMRCASEMVDHVIATQETNTITWTYILYRLSQRPVLQEQLRSELRTVSPVIQRHGDSRVLPIPASIDSLPLLNAIVIETLRLHAPNPARMRRVVPSTGLDLHGCFIPPATIISTNGYCLHRNNDAFPQPLDWMPERWLSADKTNASGTPIMRKWFWAFGSGTRSCVGQHFALQSKSSKVSSCGYMTADTHSHQACCRCDLLELYHGDYRR